VDKFVEGPSVLNLVEWSKYYVIIFEYLMHQTFNNVAKQFRFSNTKVEQSLYRPQKALSVPEGGDSHISRKPVHEVGKIIRLYPTENIPGTHFC
jgi:hypothetical protein